MADAALIDGHFWVPADTAAERQAAMADAALIDGHSDVPPSVSARSGAAMADAALIDGHKVWCVKRFVTPGPRWPTRP